MSKKKTAAKIEPPQFAEGDEVKADDVQNLRVCDETDVMASVTPIGIELQVMAIGVTMDDEGRERVVYMRLETPVIIPFQKFKWQASSAGLTGKG